MMSECSDTNGKGQPCCTVGVSWSGSLGGNLGSPWSFLKTSVNRMMHGVCKAP